MHFEQQKLPVLISLQFPFTGMVPQDIARLLTNSLLINGCSLRGLANWACCCAVSAKAVREATLSDQLHRLRLAITGHLADKGRRLWWLGRSAGYEDGLHPNENPPTAPAHIPIRDAIRLVKEWLSPPLTVWREAEAEGWRVRFKNPTLILIYL